MYAKPFANNPKAKPEKTTSAFYSAFDDGSRLWRGKGCWNISNAFHKSLLCETHACVGK